VQSSRHWLAFSSPFGLRSLRFCQKVCSIFATVAIVLAGCGSENDGVLEETFERTYTIQPNADVSIQNRDGAVLVYGSNANEMRLHATKKAYSRTRLKQIAIDVSAQPASISINTRFPPKPGLALFDRSGTVDYTIVVPATVNISQLSLHAGEVLVDGIRGESVHGWLGDGRMFAHNCFTNAQLVLQRGNLTLSYDWWESGTFSVQANIARGNAWAFLPSQAAFHLLASAAYGKLSSDFDSSATVAKGRAEATTIDQLVNGDGNATVQIRTQSGDIKIIEANP
jgi:Putative adhesin